MLWWSLCWTPAVQIVGLIENRNFRSVEKMIVDYQLALPPYSADFVEDLIVLNERVFGRDDPDYLKWRLDRMPELSTFLASRNGRLIGFKIGYAMTAQRYYSWLGGVDPDNRRSGIASELMVRQHRWVFEQGYDRIETAADQTNTRMAALNLKHGFEVSELRVEPERTQILYLKRLHRQ